MIIADTITEKQHRIYSLCEYKVKYYMNKNTLETRLIDPRQWKYIGLYIFTEAYFTIYEKYFTKYIVLDDDSLMIVLLKHEYNNQKKG